MAGFEIEVRGNINVIKLVHHYVIVKPLIKWPGGKTREIAMVLPYLPSKFDRYIEPFVGGGALFFHLEHDRNVINDVDGNLILFYQHVQNQDPEFMNAIDRIANDWDSLKSLVPKFYQWFIELKDFILRSLMEGQDLNQRSLLRTIKEDILSPSDIHLQFYETEKYEKYLRKSLISKAVRIAKLEFAKNAPVTDRWEYGDHLENAIRSAYYTMLRDEDNPDQTEDNAIFYFIREYCYGSMFRFNRKGKFNIPYGGNAYNKKPFKSKVRMLKTNRVKRLLANTKIYCMDFRDFFDVVNVQKNDFIFFDPPYDSEFKDYSKNPFTRKDHMELADIFTVLPSFSAMVIGRTKFILDLYEDRQKINANIKIVDYSKTYTYNVRGRNERETRHLLITNYPTPQTIEETYQGRSKRILSKDHKQ